MKIESDITGLAYEDKDMVFFRNTLQAAFYVFHGARLYDVCVDDKMHFVFVFSKQDHNKLKLLWKNSNIERDKVKSNG